MDSILLAVLLGFLLDLWLGDPHGWIHPVVLIGRLIVAVEGVLRRVFGNGKQAQRVAGGLLVVLVLATVLMLCKLVLWSAGLVSPWLQLAVKVWICYQILATKSLKDESMKVYHKLKAHDIAGARHAVSMIVGRDTDALDAQGITKATVETIAENTADGVIAPLFYLMIGGPVLGLCYKAINTLDSMVGYRNPRYQYFGTAAAKLDDVANFIPARLSALLMIAGSAWIRLQAKQAIDIFKRDRYNHKSPNSAQTESVMAGALQVQLAGDAVYFGKVVKKPTIGDPIRPIEPLDIKRANRLLYTTALFAVLLFSTVRVATQLLW